VSRGKRGQQKRSLLQQRDRAVSSTPRHGLCPGSCRDLIPALLLSAAACPAVPGAAERGHRAGSFNHRLTTLTLIPTLCGTKKRIFPVIPTRFAFVSPPQETGLQFQQQRAGTVAAGTGACVCGDHATKATSNLPSAILVGQQFSRWPTLPSSGKASPPCRAISALICNASDASKVLS